MTIGYERGKCIRPLRDARENTPSPKWIIFFWCERDCSLRIYSSRSTSQPKVLSGCFAKVVSQFVDDRQMTGSSTMTILLPTPYSAFSSFWQKTACLLCPILPIHSISPWNTFFMFPQMKIVLKGFFADVGEIKQKRGEALKNIRNCFEMWKKCLVRGIACN